jgi:non-canonical purine NTP pyrophosphatase (RdgB/HAM1 family)
MTISICTTNKSKVREFERILVRSLDPVSLEVDEPQTLDTGVACRAKAEAAFQKLGRPVVVDDTGFELEAISGFPGALVTWAINAGSTRLLHRMIPDGGTDRATVVTAIGYADVDRVEVFIGRLEGRVIAEPRGSNGFGFDEVFIPIGQERTLAEMSDEEKDAVSPRGLALRALADFLHARSTFSNMALARR